MNRIIKSTAVIAAAAALVCSSGCSGDTKWSYKTDTKTLSSGNWIYQTYISTVNGFSKIHEEDEKAELGKVDFSTAKIEGKDARKWIEEEAKKAALTELVVADLAKKYDASYTDEEYNSTKSMYEYYYANFYNAIFEKLGIGQESYLDATAQTDLLKDAVFLKLYGKGGDKEVSDEDLNQYFTDNYISYYYVSYDLSSSDESSESSAESSEESSTETETDKKNDKKETAERNFNKYVKMLNEEGKTTDDVNEAYKTDFSVETVPSTSTTERIEDMTDGDLKEKLTAATAKKAEVVTIDNTLYLIYRFDIKDKVANIKQEKEEGDTSEVILRDSVLRNMKTEEYKTYLEDETKNLKYNTNDACISRYSVQRTIDIVQEDSKS